MRARIITGLIGIPIVIALVFWPGGVPFAVFIAIASYIGLSEVYKGAKKHNLHAQTTLGLTAAMLLMYFGWKSGPELPQMVPIFASLTLLALVFDIMRKHRAPLANVSTTLFGVAYVALLMLHFIWLRGLKLNYPWDGSPGGIHSLKIFSHPIEHGALLVMFVLFTSWALDTGAYFVGKFYGKNKLAPRLSPGKTWEGSVGGFVSAMIIAAIAAAIIHMPQPHGLILGALIGISGQIGDLTESAIKREIGVKDFGSIMPGHGGVMDRLDSLLFTVTITYWYIVTFLPNWIMR